MGDKDEEFGHETEPFRFGPAGINNRARDTSEIEPTPPAAGCVGGPEAGGVDQECDVDGAGGVLESPDRPERFAAPWPAKRTAKMLRDQHEYEELKAFNLWPYGDLGTEKDDAPQN